MSGAKTLSIANGNTDEARSMILDVTSGTGGTVTIPGVSKVYIVRNASTGNVVITTGSGRTATIATNNIAAIICDGTNCDRAADQADIDASLATAKAYTDAASFASASGNLPGQSGNAGKYLQTNGTTATWATALAPGNNLSEVISASTARANLGVSYGSTAGTVAQGNDSRLTNAAQLTGASFSGGVSAPQFTIDANYYASLFGGVSPIINFDANDFLQYVRGSDTYYLQIGGTPYLTVTTAGATSTAFNGPLTGAVTGNVTGNLTGNVTGAMGTFTTSLTSPSLTLATDAYLGFGTGNLIVNFDANDYLVYDRTANAFRFFIAGTKQLDINGAGISTTAPITATGGIIANLTGNVTGNVSGSSGSCTGNSATATTASAGGSGFTINGGLKAGYLGAPQNTQNANYTLAAADAGEMVYHTSGSAHAWTIPPNSSVAFDIGTVILMENEVGGGNVTVTRGAGVTLYWRGVSTTSADRVLAANGSCAIKKVATDTWAISGSGLS